MRNPFVKAERSSVPLRLLIHGPSKSGKSYTALCLACAAGKTAVIDAEGGRSRIYARDEATCEGADGLVLEFDVLPLSRWDPENYVRASACAAEAGYTVLVIDGISSAWTALKDDQHQLSQQPRFARDKFGSWAEIKPRWRALMTAILDYPGDVICTARARGAYETSKNDSGKLKIEKVGLEPDCEKDTEYEFDFSLQMAESVGTLEGRLPSMSQGKRYEKPGAQLRRDLWSALGRS